MFKLISTKVIEGTNPVIFQCDINLFILEIKSKNLIDIKYSVENGHYSALVIYKL